MEDMMNSGNFVEIYAVNLIGILLMMFLRLTRVKSNEKFPNGEKIFDILIWLTIMGCFIEMLTFVIDGKIFPGCKILSYVMNSLCYIGTCTVGYFWCLYVDFRLHKSINSVYKQAKYLFFPLGIDIVMNLFSYYNHWIFSITQDNVYQRGQFVLVIYVILFFYFFYSIYLVEKSKRKGLDIKFFPVYYFVIPCITGTLIQGFFYGITAGWTSVAIALIFVYIQVQSMNAYVDSLSGLYNRRYMDHILSTFKKRGQQNVYGIMIDVNDFKSINDHYGHFQGDNAIRIIGEILTKSLDEHCLAIRYAGDEFIFLMQSDSETDVKLMIRKIEDDIDEWNQTGKVPFQLSLAMGYSQFDTVSTDIEKFLSDMDKEMYLAKKNYYQQIGIDRRH